MSEPFDIGYLIPKGVRRVKLVISLKPGSAFIKVSGAEDGSDLNSGLKGVATLWRDVGAPLLIKVPAGIQVVVIEADAET